MKDKRGTGKDLEGSGFGLIEVLFRYLKRLRKTMERLDLNIVPAEIRTEDITAALTCPM
jgi:hypothetical protein